MTAATGSVLAWLAIRKVLKNHNVNGSTILEEGCSDAWMTKKLIRSGIGSGGRTRAITPCVR